MNGWYSLIFLRNSTVSKSEGFKSESPPLTFLARSVKPIPNSVRSLKLSGRILYGVRPVSSNIDQNLLWRPAYYDPTFEDLVPTAVPQITKSRFGRKRSGSMSFMLLSVEILVHISDSVGTVATYRILTGI